MFSWARMDLAALFVAVVVAAAPVAVAVAAVSDAWYINVNMSLISTPTNDVASEDVNVVLSVTIGYDPVAVTVIKSAVTVSPAIVYVPNTALSMGSVNTLRQPVLGV